MTVWAEATFVYFLLPSIDTHWFLECLAGILSSLLLSVLTFLLCTLHIPVSDGGCSLVSHWGTSWTFGFPLAFPLCRPAVIIGGSCFTQSSCCNTMSIVSVTSCFLGRVVGATQTPITSRKCGLVQEFPSWLLSILGYWAQSAHLVSYRYFPSLFHNWVWPQGSGR